MTISDRGSVRSRVLGAAALAALMAPGTALAQWEPTQPIQFVISTSPGGGSDVYARFWIGIIERHNLSPVPITPVNMPGGGGAVALNYLANQAGNPHYMLPTLNAVVTTALQQQLPVMYPSEDLTPLALLTIDPFLLWVNPANYETWEEFHEACQADRLSATGTGARTEDQIQIGLIGAAAGCEPFRYVPVGGGGEVATNVAGGHQDFNVNQPAEAQAHYPERLWPIVAFNQERFAAYPDAPTHWELEIGTDGEYAELLDLETGLHQMRGIIGPPDLPEEAIAWYENLWQQVFETQEWQDFMVANAMAPIFMNSAEYTDWLVTFEDNHVRIMRDEFGWELRSDLRERGEEDGS